MSLASRAKLGEGCLQGFEERGSESVAVACSYYPLALQGPLEVLQASMVLWTP